MKKKRDVGPIPWQYVTRRVLSMHRGGDLPRRLVKAAAMFCYFHERQWLLHSVGTNFPKGYKVQTSVSKPREPMLDHVQEKPSEDVMSVLVMALVEGLNFKDIALRRGVTGSRVTLHRAGKHLFRQMLGKFAEHIAS